MTSPYVGLGLKRVINASGKMTALGGTAQTETVAAALRDGAMHHVDLVALRRLAGDIVAAHTGAESASITSGAAAGIAIGVAAMITGSDLDAVQRLPETDKLPNEILLQSGHDVDFGARVTQMIRLGGGKPVLAGSPAGVSVEQMQAAFNEQTAGLIYVQSHHTRQTDGLTMAEMLSLGRKYGVPLLVDAAAEADLAAFTAAGADLVTCSGGKAIGGPTVGFVTGSRQLTAACELQNRGIGRAMKVGKEQILGLLKALESYPQTPSWPDRLKMLHEGLAGLEKQGALEDMRVSIEADLAGRDIKRVGISFPASASASTLTGLARYLREGDPAIFTRNHLIDDGLLLFDVREVQTTDVALIIERVRSFGRSN